MRLRGRVREEVVDQPESAGSRPERPEHPLAIQALRPMHNVRLRSDPSRAAIRGELIQPSLRQFLEKHRDLRKQGLDRVHRADSPVGAAHHIGLPSRHAISGRSMV